jgi:NADPH2:quinone reductase
MRANRIVIDRPGGPEVLRLEAVDVPAPASREAVIRQTAIGLNYIDIQHRTGRYALPAYPAPIGMEAAGIVEAVGPDVPDLKPGDRVAYASGPIGAYADRRCVPTERLVKLPAGLSETIAAAALLKGLTAHYLLFTTYPVKRGDTILIHAAAGGVGLIVCQWAKHLGARVIGTVGTAEKAELARRHGCDVPVIYTQEDFAAAVKRETGGRGVPIVYESVGKDTFENSLRCLAPRGILASFGTASGPIPPFDLFRLNTMGSLYVTSPAFTTHTQDPHELRQRASQLFDVLASGVVKIEIGATYKLADAARAQADLQARKTSGTNILVP